MKESLKSLWTKENEELQAFLMQCESYESEEFKYAYSIMQLRYMEKITDKLESIEDLLYNQSSVLGRIAAATEG